MEAARTVVSRIIGLFVGDWIQTAGIVLILLAALVVSRVLGHTGPPVGILLAIALAAHLLATTLAENRDRRG